MLDEWLKKDSALEEESAAVAEVQTETEAEVCCCPEAEDCAADSTCACPPDEGPPADTVLEDTEFLCPDVLGTEAVDQVAENSELLQLDLSQSQLSFNEQVIEKIAGLAVREVDGVLSASGSSSFFNLKSSKGVEIVLNDDKSVTVNLEVILEYGKSAPQVFQQLKNRVGQQICSMTGLTVRSVNVKVTNVLTAEEFSGKK